jgi:hypothetical protein
LCGNRQGLPLGLQGSTPFDSRSFQRGKWSFWGSDWRRRCVPTTRGAEGGGHSWGHDVVCQSASLKRPSPGESGTRPNTCPLHTSRVRHAATG